MVYMCPLKVIPNILVVYLDSELSFSKHIREAVMKATKGVKYFV